MNDAAQSQGSPSSPSGGIHLPAGASSGGGAGGVNGEDVGETSLSARLGQCDLRIRRISAWLPIALLVLLSVFLALGILVVRGVRRTIADSVAEIHRTAFSRFAAYETELVDIHAAVQVMGDRLSALDARVRQEGLAMSEERERVRSDLARFSAWAESENARIGRAIEDVRCRVEQPDAGSGKNAREDRQP